jgi:hypothetical protein
MLLLGLVLGLSACGQDCVVEEQCDAADEMVDLRDAQLVPGDYVEVRQGDASSHPLVSVDEGGEVWLASHPFGCDLGDWPLVLNERVAYSQPWSGSFARRLDSATVESGFIELLYTTAGSPYAFDEGDTQSYLIRLRQLDPERLVLTFEDPELPIESILYRVEFAEHGDDSETGSP